MCKHISKDNDEQFDYPYYIMRIKSRAITTKKQWLQEKFPKSKGTVAIDKPNSVHAIHCSEKEDHVERYKCHFKLIDLTRDDLYDLRIPGIE